MFSTVNIKDAFLWHDSVRLGSASTSDVSQHFEGHKDDILSVASHAPSNTLVTGSYDGNAACQMHAEMFSSLTSMNVKEKAHSSNSSLKYHSWSPVHHPPPVSEPQITEKLFLFKYLKPYSMKSPRRCFCTSIQNLTRWLYSGS